MMVGSPGGDPPSTVTVCHGRSRRRSTPALDTTMAPVFPWSSGRRTITSRDVGGSGFGGVAQAAASRRTATGRTKYRRVTRELIFAGRSRSSGGRVPHLHCEACSPDADGGRGGFEAGFFGSELADQTREVRHRSPGDAGHQVELSLRRREEEAPEDETASRADGEGGVVTEDDAERPVRTGAEGVPDHDLQPWGGRKRFFPAGDGGVARRGSDHADRLPGAGRTGSGQEVQRTQKERGGHGGLHLLPSPDSRRDALSILYPSSPWKRQRFGCMKIHARRILFCLI